MPPVEPARISGPSRSLPRMLLLVAAALLIARIGTGVWEQRHAPQVVERVTWVEPSRAEAESRRTHKPILYEFSAEWCGPCQTLSREVFSDAEAAAQIERMFVPVRVLDRQQEEGRNPPDVEKLEHAYQVRGFPTLIVTWPGSARYETTSGYRGREGTLQWLARGNAKMRMQPMSGAVDSVLTPR